MPFDMAARADCLAKTRGTGRRRGHAITNCTHCGPRFSILQGLADDRKPWRTAVVRWDQAGLGDWADRVFAGHPVALLRLSTCQAMRVRRVRCWRARSNRLPAVWPGLHARHALGRADGVVKGGPRRLLPLCQCAGGGVKEFSSENSLAKKSSDEDFCLKRLMPPSQKS